MSLRLACIVALCMVAHVAEAARHTRLHTPQGAVHVWWPTGYDAKTAGIVVYVHGYFTDVDRAWRQHRLPAQFAASRVNAVFVACAAPRGPNHDVAWTSLAALLETVEVTTGDLPDGRVVVVGHSGAHRTMSAWLDEGRMDTIILVDALYGEQEQFRDWLDAADDRRLIDAAALTRKWSERLHATLPDALVFERFPRAGRLRGARHARVVYVRSQFDHMGLVTSGAALPMLLRASRLWEIER